MKRRLCRLVQKFRNIVENDSILISASEYPKDAYFKEKKKEFRKTFRNREARNIAIWGYAGVGKSSFIRHFEGKIFHIPLTSFLKVSLSRSSYNMEEYKKEEIEKKLASQMNYRYSRKAIFTAFDILIFVISILFFLKSNWLKTNFNISNFAYNQLTVLFATMAVITSLRLLIMLLNLFSISGGHIKSSKNDSNVSIDISLKTPEVKESLIKMKWKIRSTVVFEDLELFGSEIFISVVQDLFQLNTEVNCEIEKSFAGKLFRTPMRFVYVCRDGEIRRKIGDKLFQDNIFIENRLTCNNLHFYVEDCINRQIFSGLCGKILNEDENVTYDFEFFCSIAKKIESEDLNFRKINQILKRYIGLWNDFSRGLGKGRILQDDYTRLMGFTIYGEYYPEDLQKFKTGSCLAIQNNSKEELEKMVDKPELFIYLTQECPDRYRVNYSCIKYIGVSAEEIERLEKEINRNIEMGEYEKAEVLIGIIDTYCPDKCYPQKYKKVMSVKKHVLTRGEIYGDQSRN